MEIVHDRLMIKQMEIWDKARSTLKLHTVTESERAARTLLSGRFGYNILSILWPQAIDRLMHLKCCEHLKKSLNWKTKTHKRLLACDASTHAHCHDLCAYSSWRVCMHYVCMLYLLICRIESSGYGLMQSNKYTCPTAILRRLNWLLSLLLLLLLLNQMRIIKKIENEIVITIIRFFA